MIAVWLGGFFGSAQQVSFIAEVSTPFVSIGAMIMYHKREDSLLYNVNMMFTTISYFVFRACFYYYMVFWKCQDFLWYRYVSFWQTYPTYKWKWCKLWLLLYFTMFLLNLFWFSKMLWGLMRGLGIDQALSNTERVLEDETDEDTDVEIEDDGKKKKYD